MLAASQSEVTVRGVHRDKEPRQTTNNRAKKRLFMRGCHQDISACAAAC